MSLIIDTADWIKRKEIQIERWATDEQGKIAFRITWHGQRFWVVARKYKPDNSLGAMARILERAADQDALVLVRFGSPDIEETMVFDPSAWLEHGRENTETRQRKFRGETWIDIPTTWGCSFAEWMAGRENPRLRPAEHGPAGSRLDDY